MTGRNGSLRLLIVDDEAPARARLTAMVAEFDGWTVSAEAANGFAALELCPTVKPDAVLLDIRMPGMDGLEVASHLSRLETPPAVIFTTAYDEYAVQAFETSAVGYLLKPVRRERLLRALAQAARVTRMQLAELARYSPESAARGHIPVIRQGQIRLIPVADISSFHADQKYVRILHSNGEDLIDESLKQLEQEFATDFVRIHRNSLLRASEIERLERDESGQVVLFMRGQLNPLAVSRRHLTPLKQRLAGAGRQGSRNAPV